MLYKKLDVILNESLEGEIIVEAASSTPQATTRPKFGASKGVSKTQLRRVPKKSEEEIKKESLIRDALGDIALDKLTEADIIGPANENS